MSRKVCFTDTDGQIGTCTKDDEDCSTCGCIPEEMRKKTEDKKWYCFQIELDNTGVLSGRPYFRYVISEKMELACEYMRKKKYWQHEIISCKCLGVAP